MLTPAVLAVAAATSVAAVLRLYHLAHQGFWFDEGSTALLVHRGPTAMLSLLPKTESTPPLFYCIAWAWARLFGFGEAGLRSLSAVAGVATVPVMYAAAARLGSRRQALILASLVACNPLLIWYSQEARCYSLLVLASAACLLAFAYVLEDPSARRAAAWALAAILALLTHYYAALLVVPQAIWLLARYRRGTVLAALAATGACGLALVPLAAAQARTGHGSWIAHIPLSLRVGQLAPESLLGFGSPARDALDVIALASAALALVLLAALGSARERSRAKVPALLLAGGLLLELLFLAAGVDDLLTRNLLALWGCAALLLAAGLSVERARALGAALAVVLCALGVASALAVARDRDLQRPDWRAVAALLGREPAAGRSPRVILIQHYQRLLPISLYLPRLRAIRGASVTAREIDIVSFTDPPSEGDCWWGSACNLYPSGMQRRYRIDGFRPVRRRHRFQFTVLQLLARRPVPVTRALVAASLHSTRLRRDELLVQG